MKMKLMSLAVLSLTLSTTTAALADSDVCKAFKANWERAEDAPDALTKIKEVEKSDPKKAPKLSPMEEHMVQLAVLFNAERAYSAKNAINEFFDVEYDSNAGSISYHELALPSGKKIGVAIVQYYPGDNPYGMVFQLHKHPTTGEFSAARPLASIQDSDLTCLTDY